ncbi:N-acetylmuramoyl-L-alanine amidase [Nonomuraea sp. NPDC050786]|uniref:peptidoglycan recognition protein family protein n=1 Tax=Nonomuraea sp. NPDC050786 TaxID=3154840 RepID=UPI003402F7F1
MRFLGELADVARRADLQVTEVPGWKTRGHGPQPEVQGIVAHHTAGWDDLHVVRDGRPGLDGPLSHFWLRKDGRVFVVAAGRCWHNSPSTSVQHDNSSAIGIEAENDGRTPWPKAQLDAYKRLCAALCEAFGLPASRVKGHKEVQRGKPDPHSLDMAAFRRDVSALMNGKQPAEPKPLPSRQGVPDFPGRALRLAMPLMTGEDVRTWQAGARRFVPELTVDGWYGPASRRACEKVQRTVGVPATGVVNAETWLLTWMWEPSNPREKV